MPINNQSLHYCQIFLVCAVPFTWALYTSSDDVIELNERNFDTRVLKSDELWVVEFYAPWYLALI